MGDVTWPVPVAYTLHVFYLEHFVRVHGTTQDPTHPVGTHGMISKKRVEEAKCGVALGDEIALATLGPGGLERRV
jgi:hypothetical protein